jgi:hypothetical protein
MNTIQRESGFLPSSHTEKRKESEYRGCVVMVCVENAASSMNYISLFFSTDRSAEEKKRTHSPLSPHNNTHNLKIYRSIDVAEVSVTQEDLFVLKRIFESLIIIILQRERERERKREREREREKENVE